MMDGRDTDDLERRLAGRLRPLRVPGADETWHRLAPHLGDSPGPSPLVPCRFRSLVALYVATLAFVFFLIVLMPGRPGGVAMPVAATTGVSATPMARPLVWVTGPGIVSVQPALPFTLWQPVYNPLNAHFSAYAYRPAIQADTGTSPGTVVVAPDTARGNGEKDDPTVAALANREASLLLGNDSGAAIVLVYVAADLRVGVANPATPGPTRLFGVTQRPAAGRTLPPGEAAWFSGAPATFVRQDGTVVLSWLAGDTFLTLTTNQSPEQAVVFAESLKPTTLVAPGAFVPTPTPTLTIPTPLPLAPRATITPCPNAPASTGRRLICPSNPAAPTGTPTFTEADVRQQYAPMPGDTGPFIAVTTPQIATVEFLTAGEAGVRLGRGMNGSDEQPLCVITLAGDFILPPPDPDYPPTAYNAVILIVDARTGDWFATTGTRR